MLLLDRIMFSLLWCWLVVLGSAAVTLFVLRRSASLATFRGTETLAATTAAVVLLLGTVMRTNFVPDDDVRARCIGWTLWFTDALGRVAWMALLTDSMIVLWVPTNMHTKWRQRNVAVAALGGIVLQLASVINESWSAPLALAGVCTYSVTYAVLSTVLHAVQCALLLSAVFAFTPRRGTLHPQAAPILQALDTTSDQAYEHCLLPPEQIDTELRRIVQQLPSLYSVQGNAWAYDSRSSRVCRWIATLASACIWPAIALLPVRRVILDDTRPVSWLASWSLSTLVMLLTALPVIVWGNSFVIRPMARCIGAPNEFYGGYAATCDLETNHIVNFILRLSPDCYEHLKIFAVSCPETRSRPLVVVRQFVHDRGLENHFRAYLAMKFRNNFIRDEHQQAWADVILRMFFMMSDFAQYRIPMSPEALETIQNPPGLMPNHRAFLDNAGAALLSAFDMARYRYERGVDESRNNARIELQLQGLDPRILETFRDGLCPYVRRR